MYQSCNVTFVNWVYMAQSLVFRSQGISTGNYEQNDEWALVKTEAHHHQWSPVSVPSMVIPEIYFTVYIEVNHTWNIEYHY